MEVGILFIREGSSDQNLDSLFQALLETFSLEADIVPFPFVKGRKDLESAFEDASDQFGEKDLFIVHRDADNAGTEARQSEILLATERAEIGVPVVPVIPVKETESWVLHALHAPDYCERIGVDHSLLKPKLPALKRIPGVNAKNRLKEIHEMVYENRGSGRSSRRRVPSFETSRSRWISHIDDPALLASCESFEAFKENLKEELSALGLLDS